MKKTYKAPKMIVVTVEQQLLDAASSLGKDGTTTINSNNAVLSRERGFSWDDDEE